jgi:hypothetical protein
MRLAAIFIHCTYKIKITEYLRRLDITFFVSFPRAAPETTTITSVTLCHKKFGDSCSKRTLRTFYSIRDLKNSLNLGVLVGNVR